MKEIIDKHSKRYIRIEVIDPVTITTKELLGLTTSSFTSYLIKIETNHWAFSDHHSEVRRRFSEFCWLKNKLLHHHPNKNAPSLPPKRLLHMTKFDPKVIQARCAGLEKFLQRVLRSFVYLSDAALHLFLQSNFTQQQIEDKLHEEIKPSSCDKRLHTTVLGKLETEARRKAFARSRSYSSGSGASGVSDVDVDSDRSSTTSGIDETDEPETDYLSSSPDVCHKIKIVLKNSTVVPGYVELNTQFLSDDDDSE